MLNQVEKGCPLLGAAFCVSRLRIAGNGYPVFVDGEGYSD
jgi:hypothetical protein